MIPNLNELTDTPIARTNLIKLEEDQLTIIQRLLAPVSALLQIVGGDKLIIPFC